MSPKLDHNVQIVKRLGDVDVDRLASRIGGGEKAAEHAEVPEVIEVEIAPVRLVPQSSHGQKARMGETYPYWIPAELHKDGSLTPPSRSSHYPWFIREVLTPLGEHSRFPALGTVQQFDHALDTIDLDADDWGRYWAQAEQLYQSVVGARFSETRVSGYQLRDEYAVMLSREQGINARVIDLYDAFLSQEQDLPELAATMLSDDADDGSRPAPPEGPVLSLSRQHIGQMGAEFPLSRSQRDALSLYLETAVAEVSAVNGPPGTGKTTLLQSVVANRLVQSVLDGERPPLILASSTNNQAITNILDSFASVSSTSELGRRWVGCARALGTYMASATKADQWAKSGGAAPLLTNDNGDLDGTYFADLQRRDLDQEEDDFVRALRDCFQGSAADVLNSDQAARFLSTRLTSEVNFIRECIDVGHELGRVLAVDEPNLFPTVFAHAQEARKRLQEADEAVERAQQARNAYLEEHDRESVFKRLFSFIPSIRRSRVIAYRFRMEPHVPSDFFAGLESVIEIGEAVVALLDRARNERQGAAEDAELWEKRCGTIHRLQRRWEQYLRNDCPKPKEQQRTMAEEPWHEGLASALDVTARNTAFLLSLHYWEARWLSAVKERRYPFSRGERGRRRAFTEMAHLTPVFVATCHSVPKFLSHLAKDAHDAWQSYPLPDLFDLVIMDEAGQVTPEVGLAPFMFGQQAIVVGDVYQIEPIWDITARRIDEANLLLAGVIENTEEFEDLQERGALASDGSAMRIAQRVCPHRIPADMSVAGALLREHRRCVDEIISYSNRYVYQNRLIPLAGSLEDKRASRTAEQQPTNSLPAMGYSSIRGYTHKQGGSRRNDEEAAAVASFLRAYEQEIVASYDNRPLSDIVGIVTPFRAQKTAIYEALANRGLDQSIVVGTVHALQGAERPIILFSPTYGVNDRGLRFFFDASFNMLNVAVSRAKDHFLAIGDMGAFNAERPDLPSGALARVLFAAPENEIAPAFYFDDAAASQTAQLDEQSGVQRLHRLSQHVNALRRAFSVASQEVVIVSPFVSIQAIDADALIPVIEDAVDAGVRVRIYTDKHLDKVNGTLRQNAARGREALEEAGAELLVRNGIHNKALAVDDRLLVEGSFNWLSAVRDPNHRMYRRDVSHVIQNEQSAEFIRDLLSELDQTPA
jgi:hypothetical protein